MGQTVLAPPSPIRLGEGSISAMAPFGEGGLQRADAWRERVEGSSAGDPLADVIAQLEVLRAAVYGLGSAHDLDQARQAAILWLRGAVGSDRVGVRLYLSDRSGVLRLAASDGEAYPEGRKRSARRRTVFQSNQTVRVALQHPPSRTLAILPLAHRGKTVGVVEVVAPTQDMNRRWGTLDAVVRQISGIFHELIERDEADRASKALDQVADLVGRLVQTTSAQAAVRAVAEFVYQCFRIPVAGWGMDGRPDRLDLTVAKGMGSRKRAALRSQMGDLPRSAVSGDEAETVMADRFSRAIGGDDVSVVIAPDCILMAADVSPEARASLRTLGSLLTGVMQLRAGIERAELRSRQLDAGVAWTAHEFRGPVLGTKAALDCLLQTAGGSELNQDLLQRSRRELELLASEVDSLLRWAMDASSFQSSVVDLVQVAKEAIDSTVSVHGQGRVSLAGGEGALVDGNASHLRRAIANVVRNALRFSPEDSTVDVVVGMQDGFATVSVRDRGPGIAMGEREAIFHPFVQGSSATMGGGGNGLGLFVTKRVIESHGGWIQVESGAPGATFLIGLPLASGEPVSSVSQAWREPARSKPSSLFQARLSDIT